LAKQPSLLAVSHLDLPASLKGYVLLSISSCAMTSQVLLMILAHSRIA
jgi:hypothetical protein